MVEVSKDTHDNDRRRHDDPQVEATLALANAVNELACAVNSANNINAVLERIAKAERTIMSALSDQAARFDTTLTAIGASVDEIVTAQAGIAGDVTELKRLIAELQNNPGPISSADQALLDALEVKINATNDKVVAVATALKDLDAQTGPVVIPPTEPTV